MEPTTPNNDLQVPAPPATERYRYHIKLRTKVVKRTNKVKIALALITKYEKENVPDFTFIDTQGKEVRYTKEPGRLNYITTSKTYKKA